MKVTYYAYHFESEDNKVLQSAVGLLRKFHLHANNVFKNSFVNKNGDNIFLFRITQNFYHLIVTKDGELIKKINSDDLSYDDLAEDLEANERIGFASYIFMERDHYAIASTVQGPKNKSFNDFMNDLLSKLEINASFISFPFPTKISRQDALRLGFIGKTVIEVDPESNAFSNLGRMLGLSALPNELNSIEVTIKPRRGQDIKRHIPALNEAIGEEGVIKYLIKAKENLDESLSDFYISGNGYVSDYINPENEDFISTQIANCKAQNENLNIKLTELRNDRRYSNVEIERVNMFNHDSAWVDYISNHYSE